MIEPLVIFRRRRRIALWFGVVAPAALLLAAFVSRHAVSPHLVGAFVLLAIMLGWIASRAYRCPFCDGVPEEDIPTFYPKACCHCGEPLR
jgi:hypothetical protein